MLGITPGEWPWVIFTALFAILEIAGVKGWRIPFTSHHFIALTRPVRKNIKKHRAFNLSLAAGFFILFLHWFTDWFDPMLVNFLNAIGIWDILSSLIG